MAETQDPVERHLVVFDRLRARKRWHNNTTVFRYVALTLGAVGPTIDYDRLEEAAAGLKRRARWTSPFKSEARYAVAAIILRHGLDPAEVHRIVYETRDAFKASKLPSRGVGPTLAALLLALLGEARPVPAAQIERLARIYRQWRKDHFWLTSSRDLPTAALHAARDRSVESVTLDVKRAYARLREAGLWRGNPLQLVSHLLAADPRGVDTAVQRFLVVAERLRNGGERIGPGRYDEVAMLALTGSAPNSVAERVLRFRDRLREAKPRPTRGIAFSLAAGIVLAEDGDHPSRQLAGDLAALHAIQAIIDAQQAAAASAAGAH